MSANPQVTQQLPAIGSDGLLRAPQAKNNLMKVPPSAFDLDLPSPFLKRKRNEDTAQMILHKMNGHAPQYFW